MNLADITILSVSFNNDLFTAMMLKSLKKQLGTLPSVLIIDNGTIPINENFKCIFQTFDNTNQKITGNYKQISKNHCSSIDYAIKNLIHTKWVMLVDNDIHFKPSIKKLLDELPDNDFDVIGEIGYDDAPPQRLFPYMCLINVNRFKCERMNYFDNARCIGPDSVLNGPKLWYKDTGCSFLEDITEHNWRIKNINLNDFIVHFKAQSIKSENSKQKWLATYAGLR